MRHRNGAWWMAAIELPANSDRASGPAKSAKKAKPVFALPKGLVDPGERSLETALREVYEETGIQAEVITKLADIKYVYTRTWAGGERVFKIVSFYLMLYRSGRINEISAEMRIEVARAFWERLEEAPMLLAYKGERQMAQRALDYVVAHSELAVQERADEDSAEGSSA